MNQNTPSALKITAVHRERRAVVYIRQSSAKQVRLNTESQRNQRALVDRALALGWPQERITVLDADLAQSGTSTAGRDAFTQLTAEVALGHVGIIFGWEVSRLARNNADWYQLLDLAALVGALIADSEGVYDPRAYNDRLLLGLKGTMSEAELHMMRQRLDAGRLSKVQRGEYVQHLPTGLVRLDAGRVVKDPDAQVRHVIDLVFATFAELGSCRQTLRFCKEQGILLPRHQTSGFQQGELLWKQPSAAAIYEMVTNPAYAGAFVYGRRPTDPRRRLPGRRATGVVRKPPAEWICCHRDVYPAYISWDQYQANQERLHANDQRHWARFRLAPGSARQGAALLAGLATCGACGHRMHVAYKPGVRYVCCGLKREFAEPTCAWLEGPSIEARVVHAFFAALQPAQFDALTALLTQQHQQHQQVLAQWRDRVQRATYEAQLARRRYEAVDPANRLVAAELERCWEERLVALRETEEAATRAGQVPDPPMLAPAVREQLTHLAEHLPTLWESGRISNEHKKGLLRSLIARVILTRTAPDAIEVKIVWVSGHFTVEHVIPPIHRQADLTGYAQLVAQVRTLWEAGQTDTQIAVQLTAAGYHAARGPVISARVVLKIRRQHGWESRYHHHRRATMIDGHWTIHGLAQKLGVDRNWLYDRIYRGDLRAPDLIRVEPYGNYLVRNDAVLLERLQHEAQTRRGRRHLA